MTTVDPSQAYVLRTAIYERDTRPQRTDHGTWVEPSRELRVYHRCEVLVVGGGPAGTAAAVAAARCGADVALLERYNHLGGLSTGGLVCWIDRMSDWDGRLVIRGFGEELIGRLPRDAVFGPAQSLWGSKDPALQEHWFNRASAFHGIVTWAPTVDPEYLKLASQELVLENKVKPIYHACASFPIVENGVVKGIVFDSKEGRMAIFARVVIDATGDGDIFARAGGGFENDIEQGDIHHCVNTAFLFCGVDMERWLDFKATQPDAYAAFLARGREEVGLFERPHVSWRNEVALFMGPRQAGFSAVDIADMTEVEIRSKRAMLAHLAYYRRNAPGFENAYIISSAPQLGVRHSRRLKGIDGVLRSRWPSGTVLADEIGVSPSPSPQFPSISVPYGALVPERLDGVLAPGRHLSCDRNSHGFMREIPQCWLTGQAAGAAAAVAAAANVVPRAVDIAAVQAALAKQGAYVRTQVSLAQSA